MPKTVIQNHHIRYKGVRRFAGDSAEEWKEPVYKGEHRVLFLLSLRRKISEGFLISLKEELLLFEKGVDGRVIVDLSNPSRLKQ